MRPQFFVVTISSLFVVSTSWLAACSSDTGGAGAKSTDGGDARAASGGASATGGAGATSAGGTAGQASGAGGADTGGSVSNGGVSQSGAGGTSAGGMPSGGSSNPDGGGNVPLDFFARYEAEASQNVLTYPVEGIANEGNACPTGGVKEGANCSSGGKVVNQILGRSPCTPPTSTTSYNQCQNKGGGVTFNGVTVPADGTYEVTWWYHCGGSDFYGDTKCGGLDYKNGPGTGCRPHLIDVNGVAMSATVDGKNAIYYQFPCYPGSWTVVHGATTALPLKAGKNTIYIHAPGAQTLDGADLDALDVHAQGQGTAPAPAWPKLVTPVVSGY